MTELSVFPPSTSQADDGRLALAGVALADIAERFGTPAFVVDEDGLRAPARAYNGALRPPVVMCRDGAARAVVRRERYEDLLARDVA